MNQVLVTISITILTGVVLYLLNEFFNTYFSFKRQFLSYKGQIISVLGFYKYIVRNPIKSDTFNQDLIIKSREASVELRKLSTDISGYNYVIGNKKFLRKYFDIPSFEVIQDISRNLMGLSNGCESFSSTEYNQDKSYNRELLETLEKKLGFK